MLRKSNLSKTINLHNVRKVQPQERAPMLYQLSKYSKTDSKTTQLIRDSLDQTQKDFEKEKFDQFCNRLYEIYEKEQLRKENADKRNNEFLITSISSRNPIRDAMKIYRAYQIGFDDENVAASIEHVAKLCKVFGDKQTYYADLSKDELLENWRFTDMIEDIRYMLLKGNSVNNESLVKIADALAKIGYQDAEIQNSFLQKLNRLLLNQDEGFEVDQNNLNNYPQYGKKGYYARSGGDVSLRNLLQNSEFKSYIDAILFNQKEKAPVRASKEDSSVEEVGYLLDKLTESIKKNESVQKQLGQAIVAVREQFNILNEAQREQFIAENIFLRSELLELEEMLLDAGILSLQDIVDPKNITDGQLKVQNAANILQNLLLEQKSKSIDPTISKLTEAVHTLENKQPSVGQQQSISIEELAPKFNLSSFGKCVASLADLASLKKGAFTDIKYVNDRWNELLPNINYTEVSKEHMPGFETSTPQRYRLTSNYTNIWQTTAEYLESSFASTFETLSAQGSSVNTLEAAANLAYAYSKVHLSRATKSFLNVANASLEQINNLSRGDLVRLVKSLNYVSNFDKAAFTPKILGYISQHGDQFTVEEALETLHFLALHNLHETKEFSKLLKIVNTLEVDNSLTSTTTYQRELLYDLSLLFEQHRTKNPKAENKLALTPHLELLLKTQSFTVQFRESAQTQKDPLKDLIVQGIEKSLSRESVKIVPSSLKKLPQEYHPDLFYTSENKNVGLFVGQGDLVSRDENEVSATYQFRCRLLEALQPEVVYKVVSYQQFLEVDYQNARIGFAPEVDFEKILDSLAPQNKHNNILENVFNSLLKEFNEKSSAAEIRSFFEQLQNYFAAEKEYTSTFVQEHKLLLADKLKYRLAHLHDAYRSSSDSTQQKINALIQQQSGKDFLRFLQEIKDTLNAQKRPSNQEIVTLPWHGVVFGEEVAVQSGSQDRKDINKEIINYPFLWDSEYHTYDDWRSVLDNSMNKNNVDFNTLEAPKNYHGERRIPQGLIPNVHKLRNSIKTNAFPWNWEAFSYKLPQEFFKKFLSSEINNLSYQQPLTQEQQIIANLQNLKVEWKATLSDAQIVNKLVEFDFVEQLISEHIHQTQSTLESSVLPQRDAKAYMDYLEKLSRTWILKDHYASFFFNQGFKEAEVKSLKQEYEAKQKQILDDHMDGKITLKEYNQVKDELRSQYIAKLEDFSHSKSDRGEVYSNDGRIFNFNIDFKSLAKQGDLENLYNFQDDKDFTRAEGDLESMLDLKRRKAETKLIKLRIIKKLYEQQALSKLETEYLKKWKESIKSSSLNDLDLTMVPKESSKKVVRSLSQKDKDSFGGLDFFNLSSIENLALTDLILEISLFYDESVISRVESQLKGETISKEWDISSNFNFDATENREVRLVLDSVEENIWRRGGKFTPENIEAISEMFGVLRGKTKNDKQWHKVDQESFQEFVQNVNQYENRDKFLIQWFEKKENELLNRNTASTPPHFIKPDSFYRKIYQPKLDKKIRLSVEAVFNKSYDQIQKTDLHTFVENIIERLYLLKKYLPEKLHFVIKGVLNHPNLSVLDRNNLQSALDMQNINIKTSDSHITAINDVEVAGEKLEETDLYTPARIKSELQRAKIPFIQDLCKKIQSL